MPLSPLSVALTGRRLFSVRAGADANAHATHVAVPCAQSGIVVVSLYNMDHAPASPVLLYLPPSSGPQPSVSPSRAPSSSFSAPAPRLLAPDAVLPSVHAHAPPAFLLGRAHPVVAIHYRWSAAPQKMWPLPLHDVLFAYDWIKTQLALAAAPAATPTRRDLFVYGTHLGAGLAAVLALTETQPAQRVAVRGVAAYNGIYNWTAFLEGRHGEREKKNGPPGIPPPPASLFATPADLFDPFASPSLFFRTPRTQLLPPPAAFGLAPEESGGGGDGPDSGTAGVAGRAYLSFPPTRSSLALPTTLLLHDSTPLPAAAAERPKRTKRAPKYPETTAANNTYAAQAAELAALMRRSLDHGVKTRAEANAGSGTAPPLVEAVDVGAPGAADGTARPQTLNAQGQARLLDWLDEQMRETSLA